MSKKNVNIPIQSVCLFSTSILIIKKNSKKAFEKFKASSTIRNKFKTF